MQDGTTKKIEHQSLSDRAYQELRQGLTRGIYPPMQPLVIRTLAAEYGISATPIREALQRLVAERILVMRPNRSIVVPELTRARFDALIPIRCSLEGLAAALATPRFDTAGREALGDLVGDAGAATRAGDAAAYLQANRAFHFAIYHRCDNPELLQMIRDLWLKVGPMFSSLFVDEAYRRVANDHHAAIYAAIEAGDAEAARRALVRDIERASESLLPRLAADPA